MTAQTLNGQVYDRVFTADEYYEWIQRTRKLESTDEQIFTEKGGKLWRENWIQPDNDGYKVFYRDVVGWIAPDEKVYVRYSDFRRLAIALIHCRQIAQSDDVEVFVEEAFRSIGINREGEVS